MQGLGLLSWEDVPDSAATFLGKPCLNTPSLEIKFLFSTSIVRTSPCSCHSDLAPAKPEELIWGFPKIRGTHNKDYSILGSILGSPYLGKLPFKVPL